MDEIMRMQKRVDKLEIDTSSIRDNIDSQMDEISSLETQEQEVDFEKIMRKKKDEILSWNLKKMQDGLKVELQSVLEQMVQNINVTVKLQMADEIALRKLERE